MLNNYQKDIVYYHKFFEKNRISHVFIKSYLLGNYGYKDSNIDILIDQKDLVKIKKILVLNNFKKTYSWKEPEKIMFKKKNYINLHLHHRISWNTIDFLNKNEVKSIILNPSYLKLNNYFIPVESDLYSFLIHSAHMIFENYEFNKEVFLHLYKLSQKKIFNKKSLQKIAYRNGINEIINYMINKISNPCFNTKNIPFKDISFFFYKKMKFENKNKNQVWVCIKYFWFYLIFFYINFKKLFKVKK